MNISRMFFIGILCYGFCFAAPQFESNPERRFPYRGTPGPNAFIQNGKHPEIGLYVGKGTWSTGKEHLKMFFIENGYSYRTLTAHAVFNGEIESSGIQVLVMPGGESWEYLAELGDEGGQRIRDFVGSGGGYIGICAGAFYATSHREGGHTTGPYGIGLLQGTAYDGTALGTPPFIEGMMDFPLIDGGLTAGLAESLRIVMFGGPSFRYTPAEAFDKKIQVLARFVKVGEPAMIHFSYGTGDVFLAGPHLEIEEDRTDWGPEFFDPESDWPLLEEVVEEMVSR